MSHVLCHQTYCSDQGKIWPVRRIVCPGDRAAERNANFGDAHPEYQLVDGKWRRVRQKHVDQDGTIVTETHDVWFEEESAK